VTRLCVVSQIGSREHMMDDRIEFYDGTYIWTGTEWVRVYGQG